MPVAYRPSYVQLPRQIRYGSCVPASSKETLWAGCISSAGSLATDASEGSLGSHQARAGSAPTKPRRKPVRCTGQIQLRHVSPSMSKKSAVFGPERCGQVALSPGCSSFSTRYTFLDWSAPPDPKAHLRPSSSTELPLLYRCNVSARENADHEPRPSSKSCLFIV